MRPGPTPSPQSAITGLQSELAALTKALEGEKEKADNLQVSFVEVMELKQHEVRHILRFRPE